MEAVGKGEEKIFRGGVEGAGPPFTVDEAASKCRHLGLEPGAMPRCFPTLSGDE